MWTMVLGARVQPLLMGADLPTGKVASWQKCQMKKAAGWSERLGEQRGNVLTVRGCASPITRGCCEDAGQLEFCPAHQVGQLELSSRQPVVKAREGVDSADASRVAGEQGRLIDRQSAGRRELIAGSAAVLAAALCACCVETVEAAPKSRSPPTLTWKYGSPCGPVSWGAVCSAGSKQSPINLLPDKVKQGKGSEDLIFDYSAVAPTFMNTGHGTMQVNFLDGRNKLRIGARILDLIQFHFHTPSEHTFNGVHYNMEAHLVHRDPKSKALAVVGVMLDAKGNMFPNKALQAALDYSPKEHYKMAEGPRNFTMSPSLLLPASGRSRDKRGYMHYSGSLTTPPCWEGVDWFVMETPVGVSSQQVLDFMKFVGDFQTYASNTRPLQPLGNRVIVRGPTM